MQPQTGLRRLAKELRMNITLTPLDEFKGLRLAETKKSYVLTILGADRPGVVAAFSSTLAKHHCNIERIKMIARGELLAMEMWMDLREANFHILRKDLTAVAKRVGMDIVAQPEHVFKKRKKVIVFDMDSTIINGEIIDEVYFILLEKNPSDAEMFYQRAHQILYRVELRAAEKGRLIPGVERALKFLRGKGIKIGITTRNCEDAVRKVFPNIDEFCDVFISRNSVKKVKPHPDHLSSTMKALDVSGEEAVIIGDHTIDIQAGKRVGMKTIGVLTGRTEREEFKKAKADYVFDNATEICKLIPPSPL